MEGTSPQVAHDVEEAGPEESKGGSGGAAERSAAEPEMDSKNGEAAAAGPNSGKAVEKAGTASGVKAKDGIEIPDRPPIEINLRTLLQAGVHFGHQTSRWSPAMAPYIHSSRNGIHIINLPHTMQAWLSAREAIVKMVAGGGSILIVGTKKQAADAVVQEARRCGAYYVSRRWLGGMITNFQTIRKSIDRLQKLETVLEEEDQAQTEGLGTRFTKKERLMMSRERDKLEFSLGGIRTMMRAPAMMFVIDIKREDIAVREAQRLDIPVVALVDTNCDPRTVEYPIPSNDDGTRAIRLFCGAVADAVMEGKRQFKQRKAAEPAPDVPVSKAEGESAGKSAGRKKAAAKSKKKAVEGEETDAKAPSAAEESSGV